MQLLTLQPNKSQLDKYQSFVQSIYATQQLELLTILWNKSALALALACTSNMSIWLFENNIVPLIPILLHLKSGTEFPFFHITHHLVMSKQKEHKKLFKYLFLSRSLDWHKLIVENFELSYAQKNNNELQAP